MSFSWKRSAFAIAILAIIFLSLPFTMRLFGQDHKIHDTSRSRPPIITPATSSTQEKPGLAPGDAVVLFEGKDLSNWRSMDGSAAKWIVKDGYMESVRGSGYIRTTRCFGDCQLHVEFATPSKVEGSSQGRGNSGVFLMGKYEVQVLDSYDNITYADGQCSAVYGQYPPQVNASRKPGDWQSYDIIFRRPIFNDKGEIIKAARITVLQNGVLTQENVEIMGPTAWTQRLPYKWHADKLPLSLQDHGNPVRYRNIWIRELAEPGVYPAPQRVQILPSQKTLENYIGAYQVGSGMIIKISKEDEQLYANITGDNTRPIYAESETHFFSKFVDAEFDFNMAADGKVTGLTLTLAGGKMEAKKID